MIAAGLLRNDPKGNAPINIFPHYPLPGKGGGFDFLKIQIPHPRGMKSGQIPTHHILGKLFLQQVCSL